MVCAMTLGQPKIVKKPLKTEWCFQNGGINPKENSFSNEVESYPIPIKDFNDLDFQEIVKLMEV